MTLRAQEINSPSRIRVSDDELAVRGLPLRAIFGLEVLARCEGRLHLAAKILGVSNSALSTQITRMEAILGSDVVRKAQIDGRRFEFTDTGEMLVAALRSALPDLVTLTHSFNHAVAEPAEAQRRRAHKSPNPRRR
jgi:DNA-binding transcriptional LysR family regulator